MDNFWQHYLTAKDSTGNIFCLVCYAILHQQDFQQILTRNRHEQTFWQVQPQLFFQHIGFTFKVWSPGTVRDAPYGADRTRYAPAGSDFCHFSQNATARAGELGVEGAKARLDHVRGLEDAADLELRYKGQVDILIDSGPLWPDPSTVLRAGRDDIEVLVANAGMVMPGPVAGTSRELIDADMDAIGLRVARSHDFLPEQYFVEYLRA